MFNILKENVGRYNMTDFLSRPVTSTMGDQLLLVVLGFFITIAIQAALHALYKGIINIPKTPAKLKKIWRAIENKFPRIHYFLLVIRFKKKKSLKYSDMKLIDKMVKNNQFVNLDIKNYYDDQIEKLKVTVKLATQCIENPKFYDFKHF